MMKKFFLCLLVIGAFSGCLKDQKCTYNECAIVAPSSEVQAVKDYLTANNITASQHCSGMFYTIDNAGTGKYPNACSNVAVKYEGKLTNGKVFDSATSPVAFNLSGLITGFKNGIPLIKSGGQIHLYIPPTLGYGSAAVGSIPPNSILIFDVSLVDVQ